MPIYILQTKFEKDNKHLGSISNQSKITFQKTTPTLNISIPAGTYNAESNFNIQVTPKNPDGTAIIVPRIPIKFYIDDVLVKSDTTQQEGYYGTLTVPSGATGSINIKVVLEEDSMGYYNSATKTVTLALGTPSGTAVDTVMTLSANKQNVEVGSNVTLTATLKTKSGTPLVNRQIIFKKGNSEIDAIYTNNDGVATKTVNITNAGANSFNAVFNGETNNYKSSSANIIVQGVVTTIQPVLTMVSSTNIYKGWNLKLLYCDNNNQPLPDKTVNITINGVTYQRTTESNGIAKINLHLDEDRTYPFSANVAANGKYLSASMTGSIKVIRPITVERKPGCVSCDAAAIPRKTWDKSHQYSDADVYKDPTDAYYLSSGAIASKAGTWHAIQPLNQACFGFNIPNGSIIQKIEAVWLHKYSRNNSNPNMGAGTVYLDATGQDTIVLQGANKPGNNTWTQNNASTTNVSMVSANALNQNAFQAKIVYEANSNYNTGELHLGWFSIKVTYVPPQE